MNRLGNKKQTRSDSGNEANGLSVVAVEAGGVEDAEALKVEEVMKGEEATKVEGPLTHDAEETRDLHPAEEVLRTVDLHHAVKQTPGFLVVAEHTGEMVEVDRAPGHLLAQNHGPLPVDEDVPRAQAEHPLHPGLGRPPPEERLSQKPTRTYRNHQANHAQTLHHTQIHQDHPLPNDGVGVRLQRVEAEVHLAADIDEEGHTQHRLLGRDRDRMTGGGIMEEEAIMGEGTHRTHLSVEERNALMLSESGPHATTIA